jgi:hypothetical protein
VCTDELRVDVATGKHLLTTVANGSTLVAPHNRNRFLQTLSKAGRFLRFLVRLSDRVVFAVLLCDNRPATSPGQGPTA